MELLPCPLMHRGTLDDSLPMTLSARFGCPRVTSRGVSRFVHFRPATGSSAHTWAISNSRVLAKHMRATGQPRNAITSISFMKIHNMNFFGGTAKGGNNSKEREKGCNLPGLGIIAKCPRESAARSRDQYGNFLGNVAPPQVEPHTS